MNGFKSIVSSRIAAPLLGIILSAAGLIVIGRAAAEPELAELKGLSQAEVEQLFGAPDERRGAGVSKESWSFGASIVLFRDGKVTAWSDAGDLGSRQNVARLKKTGPKQAQIPRVLWNNPWTPSGAITEEQVVDEILEKAKTISAAEPEKTEPANSTQKAAMQPPPQLQAQ